MNRRQRESLCSRRWIVVIWGLLLTLYAQPSGASWFGDSWSRFDRFLATFDPAGRYMRQPVEKTIPALTFKGFYRQWSDILLTGDQRVGFRQKDFRFLQL